MFLVWCWCFHVNVNMKILFLEQNFNVYVDKETSAPDQNVNVYLDRETSAPDQKDFHHQIISHHSQYWALPVKQKLQGSIKNNVEFENTFKHVVV